MNLLQFPEELLERVLEEVVLYPSFNHHASHNSSGSVPGNANAHPTYYDSIFVSPEDPSRTLGPSPISTPSSTPKSSPSSTRNGSPHAPLTRARPDSQSTQSGNPNASSSSTAGQTFSRSPIISTGSLGSGTNPHPDSQSGGSCGTFGFHSDSIAPPTSSSREATKLDSALAPLLTCRLLSRIALPLYFRVVHLKSRAQARTFLEDALGYRSDGALGAPTSERDQKKRGRTSRRKNETLKNGRRVGSDDEDGERKRRARWIRRLVLGGVWKEAGMVVHILADLVSPPAMHSAAHFQSSSVPMKGKGKARATTEDDEWDGRLGYTSGAHLALRVLEITIDSAPPAYQSPVRPIPTFVLASPSQSGNSSVDEDAEVFTGALLAFAAKWAISPDLAGTVTSMTKSMGTTAQANPLKHIVLRKPQNVYLTHPRARNVISALARVVETAEGLESAFVAFRISDDPQGLATPNPAHQVNQQVATPAVSVQQARLSGDLERETHDPVGGPITQLTSALAGRPNLKTFATMLPSVWNEAVLRVSKCEALERIVLLGVNGMPVCAPPTSPPSTVANSIRPVGLGISAGGGSGGSVSGANGGGEGANVAGSTSSGGSGSSWRPRTTVALPLNPVQRVYAASARGVDGYHPTNSPPASSIAGSAGGFGIGGGGTTVYGGGAGFVPMGTGLFMNGARKHERLCELIGYGAGVGERQEERVQPRQELERGQSLTKVSKKLGNGAASGGGALLSMGSGSTFYASCSSWLAARFNGGSATGIARTGVQGGGPA